MNLSFFRYLNALKKLPFRQILYMKYLKFLFVTVFAFCLVACYEINEEIVINENGTGTYVTKMDLGALLDMLQSVAGKEELGKEGMDKTMDTVIMMKDVIDSMDKATPEQKELLKDGKMRMQMNMKEKLFKIEMNMPYKSFANLQALMSGQGTSGAGMSGVFKNMFDKGEPKKQELDAPAPTKEPDLDKLGTVYDVTVKNGLISRKLNQKKYDELMAQPEMEQMKAITGAGMEVLYTTTIKLPRPVKKSDNALVKLSDDKKTVTFKYNLLDMFSTPEKFAYTIEY